MTTKTKTPAWTPERKAFLQANYQKRGARYCAEKLETSESSISNAARRFGFNRVADDVRIDWTTTKDAMIRRAWQSPKKGAKKACAETLGLPFATVSGRALKLGAAHRSYRTRLSPEQIAIIREHADKPGAHIARILARQGMPASRHVLARFRNTHGLRVPTADKGETFTSEELATALGINPASISQLVLSGAIKGTRGGNPLAPHGYSFKPKQIIRLIAERPSVVNQHAVDMAWLIDFTIRYAAYAHADDRDKIGELREILADPANRNLKNTDLAAMIGSTATSVATLKSRLKAINDAARRKSNLQEAA